MKYIKWEEKARELGLLEDHDDDTFREMMLLTKEELKPVLFCLMVNFASVLGILFALITFYHPRLLDFYNYDVRDPFNLQEGWLLWAIIGVIFANIATFGTTLATKYYSKRWPQPKAKLRQKHLTKDSIYTGHDELDELTRTPEQSILLFLVMLALLLPPVVEEYVYSGYLMVLWTKWLAATMFVVFSSFIIALVHLDSEQGSHLFVGVLALGLPLAKTFNPMTAAAMHLLLVILRLSVAFITFMRQSFSRRTVAKEVNYRAKEVSYHTRRHTYYGGEFGSRKVIGKRKDGTKGDLNGKRKGRNDAIQGEITLAMFLTHIWRIFTKEDYIYVPAQGLPPVAAPAHEGTIKLYLM